MRLSPTVDLYCVSNCNRLLYFLVHTFQCVCHTWIQFNQHPNVIRCSFVWENYVNIRLLLSEPYFTFRWLVCSFSKTNSLRKSYSSHLMKWIFSFSPCEYFFGVSFSLQISSNAIFSIFGSHVKKIHMIWSHWMVLVWPHSKVCWQFFIQDCTESK